MGVIGQQGYEIMGVVRVVHGYDIMVVQGYEIMGVMGTRV